MSELKPENRTEEILKTVIPDDLIGIENESVRDHTKKGIGFRLNG
jgi:hypothetical protein